MAPSTVAELTVETLAAYGVRRIYGVAGDSLNGITDSIRRNEQVHWVPVRHEEAAAFAAGAEAHLTGRLAVCAGSCGPGNLHLINGLYDAYRSREPVFALAAQIPSVEIGTGYFQETHPAELYRQCSDFAEFVAQPEQLPRLLEIALQTAIGRSSVAVLVLPGDIALQPAVHDPPPARTPPTAPSLIPAEADLARLVELLQGATKITLFAGAGCAGARSELLELAARLRAPIVHTIRGKEYVETDNPFDVGLTGLLGFASGYHAMMDCDLLLLLGTDFPYTQFYPDGAQIVQIDRRAEQLGRRTRLELGLVGDVRSTLAALLPRLAPKADDRHLQGAAEHYRITRAKLDELAVGPPGVAPIHPQYVARRVSELAADDAIFTCDVGTPTVWAARYLRMNGRRRLLGSFVHGSMAGALPQAIGAQMAAPGRQVVSLSGDGGLTMLLGELATLHQLNLPVKIVVFANGALEFVELEMESAGFLPFATELVNPDFAAVARAAGLHGATVELPEQLDPALEAAFAYPGPALIEVKVNRQEIIMPPSIKSEVVKGFTLFTLKAVLNGRGSEVIDLARTNLFRGE